MAPDAISDAEAAVAACRRAVGRAELLSIELAHEQQACRALRARLADERADVDALEGTSITSIVARLRGGRDDRLTAERAQVAAVEVELATRLRAMQRLSADFEAVRAEALELDAARDRLATAIEEREREVAGGDSTTAARLAELDARLSAERAACTEIHEAHVAALGALGALDRAIPPMTSARNWSTYDTFLDGDWLSSAIKHDRLDDSVVLLAGVHASLLKLRAELADLTADGAEVQGVDQPHFRYATPGQATMDVWFDNVFTDFDVHRKITGSLAELERTQTRVRELIDELEPSERIARERIDRLSAERDRLLRHG